jgi:polysaccharide biosynthesis/export protein
MRNHAIGQVAGLLMSLGLAGPAIAQQAPPQSVASAPVSEYRINAGDELEIYVWGEERLQRHVKVLPDGTIAFPLAGQLVARGLLPQELQQVITDRLREQYRGDVPQVTVSVVAPAGLQFSVMGKVKAPGSFTPGRYVNVLEALSMAGGPDQFAELSNIVIIRKVGNALRSYRVNMSAVLRGDIDPRNDRALENIIRIESGDTVIVP